MATLALPCHANPDGGDNFSDNSMDPANWAPFWQVGVGALTETKGRLEFSTSAIPTDTDLAAWEWIGTVGSYTEDWELKCDLSLGVGPFSGTTPQPVVNWDLMVAPGSNYQTSRLIVEFGVDQYRYFQCVMAVDGQPHTLAMTHTASSQGAVRLAFDATTKTLSGSFDEDGASCGYAWTPLASAIVPPSWGMTTASDFSVVLIGVAHHAAVVSTDNMFADDFQVSSAPLPPLQIQRAGNQVTLSWPANAPGFHLESAPTLSPPVCWGTVTNVTTVAGANVLVAEAISKQRSFFRLSR